MNAKSIVVALSSIVLLTSLVGCSSETVDENDPSPPSTTKNETKVETGESNVPTVEDGRITPQMRISIDKYGWACIDYSDGSAYCCTRWASGRESCFTQ